MKIIDEFRKAVNENEDWQEEVRCFGEDGDLVEFAESKGYNFTQDEFVEYVDNNSLDELSLFEMELVSGGASSAGRGRMGKSTRHNNNSRPHKINSSGSGSSKKGLFK